jgi:hypothetical protein
VLLLIFEQGEYPPDNDTFLEDGFLLADFFRPDADARADF